MLKQTRLTILLSLNAVAILIAGIIIASAIGLTSGSQFRVVDERSDDVDETIEDVALIDPVEDVFEAITQNTSNISNDTTSGNAINYAASVMSASSFDTGTVPNGQLWNADSVTIYQTANIDLCVNDSVGNLGDMYWQTSNPAVIAGFYSSARTKLGYSAERCRFPKILNTGSTTITAGTYDGSKRDTLTVNVIAPPINEWKQQVLSLVNAERAKVGLPALAWGDTCASGAQVRAEESMSRYEHVRPDGSSWDTVCKPTNGGVAGENLAAGNAAVSPETVVQTWMGSPTHRANILSDKFTKMAVGFVFDPNSQYKTYWSQFFSTY
ncbi:CAP domain-containing protein [Candidatus Saccharibacteria bacterium]|nr:CAP domain-containing protein [Candidatus Saccharibacteria bacterium]